MSVTPWKSAFRLFSSVDSKASSKGWLRSGFAQGNSPVIADALDASTGSPSDDVIYLQAENWIGELQAPVQIAATGPVWLTSAPFLAHLVAESHLVTQDGVFWWSPSTSHGDAYDLKFQAVVDTIPSIGTPDPALKASGAPITLISGIADPLRVRVATNGAGFVLAVAATAPGNSATQTLTLQSFTPDGAAVSAPVQAGGPVATSTVFSLVYFQRLAKYVLIESSTVNGAQGFNSSTFDPVTGALGAAKFQAVALPAYPQAPFGSASGSYKINSVAFSPLPNGDILEFVGYGDASDAPNWQGVETRLLNSSFQDISSSTPGFVSGGFNNIGQSTPAHWSVVTLTTGDTILIYSLNGVVTIEQFDAKGVQKGSYGFFPSASLTASYPGDFDSIAAMGHRFEVAYRSGSSVYAVIYDTATQGAAYTIDNQGSPFGLWAGTPFDDTISYGGGLNEIGGGGGFDTFSATGFSLAQVNIATDISGRVLFAVDDDNLDLLQGFSRIQLADAAVRIDGEALHVRKNDGTALDLNFVAPVCGDFNGDGKADILWRYTNSANLEVWQSGGGGFAGKRLDSGWWGGLAIAIGDFNADKIEDILYRDDSGRIYYQPGGDSNQNPGLLFPIDLGTFETSWRVVATGDFNGDHACDILMRDNDGGVGIVISDGTGGFSLHELAVVDATWRIEGAGDFNGDGKADILWRNRNGDVQIWNSRSAGGFAGRDFGIVGKDWRIAGIGDFLHDGAADILWRNRDGHALAWNSDGAGGFADWDLGGVGGNWLISGVGDFNGDQKADILWRNTDGDAQIWQSKAAGGFVGQDLGIVDNNWTIR